MPYFTLNLSTAKLLQCLIVVVGGFIGWGTERTVGQRCNNRYI